MKTAIIKGFFYVLVAMVSMGTVAGVAKPLTIAVGLWMPPYVIKETSRGIELDIIREVLASQGYEVEPVYFPLARTALMYRQGLIDGLITNGFKDMPGCMTQSHITYHNVAISLTKRHFKIGSIDDLKDKSIYAFQNARNFLGEDFQKIAEANPRYREIADQRTQNKLLYRERVDVVIADQYIFRWFSKDPEVSKYSPDGQGITYHQIFKPTYYSSVFRSQEICGAFNRGLKQLKETGRYQAIIASYLDGAPLR